MTADIGQRTLRKIGWHLLPFVMLLAVINYLDRVNIGIAALQMNKDLGFSAAVYGLGAGIFFTGYCFLEIPSNLILMRVGVRRWLARIMISWGIVATATAWIDGEKSFYVMRFLLGVAEAGFLPGVMFYFRNWFPARSRGKFLGIFMAYTAIANIIGAPLSTALMGAFDGSFGLRGWQMMFILEGLPAIILGIVVLNRLIERPEDAAWLAPEEKRWLAQTMDAERLAQGGRAATSLREGLLDPRVLLITALCFFLICANFGVVFWLPQIIKAFGGISNNQVGLLVSLVFICACVAMIGWGWHSDRTADRRWHLAIAALVGAIGLAAGGLAPTPVGQFVGLCVAAIGIWSMFGVFWALPADFLSGAAAASGLALINSLGTLGGFAGPFIVGFIRQRTASFSASLLVLAGSALICALISLLLRNEWRTAPAAEAAVLAPGTGD